MKFKMQMETEGTTVTIDTQVITTSELCREFQNFLTACGYRFTMDQEILVWDHSLTKYMEE